MTIATQINPIIEEIEALCRDLGMVQLMEICGTHTVSLFKTGIKSLLPENLRLVSGPGCPVCVTSQGYIDAACALAGRNDVTICTYGDMIRVPGSGGSLEDLRARQGADIMIVYSAREVVSSARKHPDRKFVFLAVGFETTTPATAAAVKEADALGVENVFFLCGHKLVMPAMNALLAEGEVPIDGFLCPGHVSIIIGEQAYKPVAGDYGKPCVVAGFEPMQLANGILFLLRQLAQGRSEVENVYGVAVKGAGNKVALQLIDEVFEPAGAVWRAMGVIPGSGLDLRGSYKKYDALAHFGIELGPDVEPPGCLCGLVIQGKATPADCKLFDTGCTPVKPIGPCMVSSEGTCAAWYKYNR